MKRLIILLSICIPIYLFAQGFGSFSYDQPFLSGSAGCTNTFPTDSFDYYSMDQDLNGLNGDCPWPSGYVVHYFEDIPFLAYQDGMQEYTAGQSMVTDSLSGGTNYVSMPSFRVISQGWTNGPYVGKGY